jgi:GH35 family endo-1,4-beta-xylanase
MKDWLALAKKTDPKAKVFVNEIDVIETGVFPSPAYNNLGKLIQSWQSDNIPIEGVGVQGHFDEGNLTKPEILLKIFDGLAAYKLDIQITEYDLKTTDEQLKADYTRDIMTVAFSHPSTSAFVMWGFWDGAHWKDDAPLFYKDWTLKPAGKAWVDLVQKQWWTNEQGQVDNQGKYSTRGFLGDYKITVKAGASSEMFNVFLDSTGIDSNLKLKVKADQVCRQ